MSPRIGADAIRELQPGDEPILRTLAEDVDEFEDDGAARPARPLEPDAAAAFLADPTTHMWVALVDDLPVGFLLAYVLRRRRGDPKQIFVYEIGVRAELRRQGIGTALVSEMLDWCDRADIGQGFLLAGEHNRTALAFYDSLGWHARTERDVVYSFHVDAGPTS
jgi:GNAT superfamily N-acetyltransferase